MVPNIVGICLGESVLQVREPCSFPESVVENS